MNKQKHEKHSNGAVAKPEPLEVDTPVFDDIEFGQDLSGLKARD